MRRTAILREFCYFTSPSEITLKNGEYHFHHPFSGRTVELNLRANSSDVDVFMQVFRDLVYFDVAQLLQGKEHELRIIDAGSNVGLTSLYLKSLFPSAHIAALEPEPVNFQLLSRCVTNNGLENVTLFNQGLWSHDTRLVENRNFRDGEAWSFALTESEGQTDDGIPVTSLGTLLKSTGWERVDLLKIDIEGAEAALLRDRSFLETVRDKVSLLCIEVHPEAISIQETQEALASVGLNSVIGKENLIAFGNLAN